MKFKISEISRMSGFSPSGIRFFEKAGLINPTRGQNQKYREFSLTDLQLLLLCKQYRECGLSLHQSVEMIKLADIHGIQAHIKSQAHCLREEITKKQLQLGFLENTYKDLDHVDLESQHCEIATLPALMFLHLWQPGAIDGEFTASDPVLDWLDLSPIVNSCLLLPEESLLHGKGEISTLWGLAIEEEHASMLNFAPVVKFERFKERRCVRVVVRLSEELTISSNQLDILREYLTMNNLQPSGPAICRLLIALMKKDRLCRYDSLWVPIQ